MSDLQPASLLMNDDAKAMSQAALLEWQRPVLRCIDLNDSQINIDFGLDGLKETS